jgi:osmotically-inducible protein OsmY
MTSEAEITKKVREALAADERLAGAEISVKAVGGVVFLDGHTDTEEQKSVAEELARGVEGVRLVRNRVQAHPEHRTIRDMIHPEGREW